MLILPWLLAIVLAACDEFVLSRLLRLEYSEHRLIWEADGKPRAIFWIPPECRLGGWYLTYASGRAGRTLGFKMLFRTPAWAAEDPETLKLVRVHRILMYSFLALFLAPFVIAALFQ
ncbi:MAG TPA: hypothetical protein VJT71_08770 [Pyrinomonadaceae bacterium]|nr:hypothetical protein [Pyrinomonadaceae bacterium]